MKILITGASGFIGGFLVNEALSRGYDVWAGVRATSVKSALQDKRIQFIDLNYSNKAKLVEQFQQEKALHGAWDYVIHNAGLTKTLDKANFERINAGYTQALIDALCEADCKPKKFLLMSSLSSFGCGDEQGFTPIGLTDPQRPDTAYGKSKLSAEHYVQIGRAHV